MQKIPTQPNIYNSVPRFVYLNVMTQEDTKTNQVGENMRLTILFVNRIPASKHKQGDVAALQWGMVAALKHTIELWGTKCSTVTTVNMFYLPEWGTVPGQVVL